MSPSLAEVQRRLRDLVIDGDRSIVGFIAGGGDATPRLAIHQRHYSASLVSVLMGRFPATAWLVGTPTIEAAARLFVRDHPPTAPCVAEYGASFPRYLATRSGAERIPYLREFAELDWHQGRVAVSVDLSSITRRDCAAIPPAALADVVIAIQAGTYYARAAWPIDELMRLYLTDSAPDRLALTEFAVAIELRGSRGSFSLSRLPAADFAFRRAIAEGLSVGEAARHAWVDDETFDPGAALVSMVDAGLATSINTHT